MMKHGLIFLALLCWAVGAGFASETGIPASSGMPGGGLTALSLEEMAAIEGGDLYLSVDRDTQTMSVIRVQPGTDVTVEEYSVKVTTSVVRNSEVTSANPKGAMENTNRTVTSGGDSVYLKQFPGGTAQLSPTISTQKEVTGPVIRTDAKQDVSIVKAGAVVGTKPDAGYNIHFVDPAKSTNTLGCIGVQSESAMAKVAQTLKNDTASYKPGESPRQTVTVSAYTQNVVPAAATFKPSSTPTSSTKKPSAPAVPAAWSSSTKKSWWKFW